MDLKSKHFKTIDLKSKFKFKCNLRVWQYLLKELLKYSFWQFLPKELLKGNVLFLEVSELGGLWGKSTLFGSKQPRTLAKPMGNSISRSTCPN